MAESETTRDAIAGWIGGAVGIVVSNPLEVLKVRLQTNATPSLSSADHINPLVFSRSPCPIHHSNSTPSALALQYSIPPNSNALLPSSSVRHALCCPKAPTNPNMGSTVHGLKLLWRQEGYRFLFAGAAAPILGLAFIDSFFFATYGKCMSIFSQDRERPRELRFVFASGATAGGLCALLQTPIEVIKCRAQAEHLNKLTGDKAGSFVIAKKIYEREGLRGFYLGGLMTGLRDSLSSGIFFTSYFKRRLARLELLDAILRSCLRDIRRPHLFGPQADQNSHTVGRIFETMVAGGSSGMISALIPYPLDVIKTRLQVQKVSSSAYHPVDPSGSKPQPTAPSNLAQLSNRVPLVAQIIKQVHSEAKTNLLPNLHDTKIYKRFDRLLAIYYGLRATSKSENLSPHAELLRQRRRTMKISLRFGGLLGFFRGLKPTLLSSFVGSAITMGIFEFVFDQLGRPEFNALIKS